MTGITFAAPIEHEEIVTIPYQPRPWQLEAHRRLKRFSVLVMHRRAGKTVMAVATLVSAALRTEKPFSRYGYIAPFRNQAVDIAWPYLVRFASVIPDVIIKEGEKAVVFPNGSLVKCYGADNEESLRGGYFDGVVMDEVASMRPSVWGEVVRPMLADREGWALFIGTVKGINMFSELYTYALTDPDWHADLKTCYDTDALKPEEIEAARQTMTEAQFRQEMLCDFSAASDDQLISLELANEASRRIVLPRDYHLAPRIMGVDVARYGGDQCVIAKRQGLMLHPLKKWRGIDNMEFAAHVAFQIQEFKPDAVFIDAGRGEGVIDRVRQLGHDCIGVDFGGKSLYDEYLNKRTEMWALLQRWLVEGGAIPKDNGLLIALAAPCIDFRHPTGKMRLESKDQMRDRGMKSPDEGDAVALTFAQPVAASTFRNTHEALHLGSVDVGRGRCLTDYDPFDPSRY